jgi:hypothetical protein
LSIVFKTFSKGRRLLSEESGSITARER